MFSFLLSISCLTPPLSLYPPVLTKSSVSVMRPETADIKYDHPAQSLFLTCGESSKRCVGEGFFVPLITGQELLAFFFLLCLPHPPFHHGKDSCSSCLRCGLLHMKHLCCSECNSELITYYLTNKIMLIQSVYMEYITALVACVT